MYPQYILHAYSIIKFKILYVQFESILMDSSLLPRGEVIGRDDRIRTRYILYPKQGRYQAALHPFQLVYGVIVENPCPVFRYFLYLYKIYLAISSFFLVFIDHHPAAPTNAYLLIRKKRLITAL